MNTSDILHAVILLAVIAAAIALAIVGKIPGELAIGVVVAAAGIAAPSPFSSSSSQTALDATTVPGLNSGA